MKPARKNSNSVKLPPWVFPSVIAVVLTGFTVWAWPPRDEPDPRVARGNQAYSRRAYPEALSDYLSAPGDGPRNAGVHRNRGITRFRIALPPNDGGALTELGPDAAVPESWSRIQDELRSAAQGGDGVVQEDIPTMVRARARYDLGNTFFARHSWREAIDAYKEALRLRPGWIDAAWNLELARRRQEDRPDAGPDAGQDASTDGGSPDSGSPDGGSPDGGSPDGGSPDGGSPDGGDNHGDGGQSDSGSDNRPDGGGESDGGDNHGDSGNGQSPDASAPQSRDGGTEAPPRSLAPLDQLERNAQDLQQMLLRRRALQNPRPPDDER